MAKKHTEPWTAKMDRPCVLLTDIMKEAAVKSGLANIISLEVLDRFFQSYHQLYDKYRENGNLII